MSRQDARRINLCITLLLMVAALACVALEAVSAIHPEGVLDRSLAGYVGLNLIFAAFFVFAVFLFAKEVLDHARERAQRKP